MYGDVIVNRNYQCDPEVRYFVNADWDPCSCFHASLSSFVHHHFMHVHRQGPVCNTACISFLDGGGGSLFAALCLKERQQDTSQYALIFTILKSTKSNTKVNISLVTCLVWKFPYIIILLLFNSRWTYNEILV